MTDQPYDHPGLVLAYRLAAIPDHRQQIDFIRTTASAYQNDHVALFNILSSALAVMSTAVVAGLLEDRDDADEVRAYCREFADKVTAGRTS